MDDYDVVIIGAGPAGLFAADELAQQSTCRISLIEKGLDLSERVAVRAGEQPPPEGGSVMLEGFGGTGAFCDGKLKLTADLETGIAGLYACGDGAGLTRGLMQATASGIAAAQAVQKHLDQ